MAAPARGDDELDERLASRRREVAATPAAVRKQQPPARGAQPGQPAQVDPDEALRLYNQNLTRPPTRERLFQLGTEREVIARAVREYRQPGMAAEIPGLEDRFDNPDSPFLGSQWIQRIWGEGDRRFGSMGLVNGVGVFPPPQYNLPRIQPDAAVRFDAVGTNNMLAEVEVRLGAPDSEFGTLVRALRPAALNTQITEEVQEILRSNGFYYAVSSANQVRVGLFQKGQTKVLGSVRVPEKMNFVLRLAAYGDELSVFRDGQEVLKVRDATLSDQEQQYAGIIGTKSSTAVPTRFDNFLARGFGGTWADRQFAATTHDYRGPNVHHLPLRFEQRALERHGQHLGNLAQPFIAQGLFVVDLIALPHSIFTTPPWTCIHDDVLFPRPGDVVLPFRIVPPQTSGRGIAAELGMFVAFGFLAP